MFFEINDICYMFLVGGLTTPFGGRLSTQAGS